MLDPTNPYAERDAAGVTYKMMELRQAGALPADMTADIQAIELCAGPQCTACSLQGGGFPCDPRDRNNMYESPNFQNNQNTLRSFRAAAAGGVTRPLSGGGGGGGGGGVIPASPPAPPGSAAAPIPGAAELHQNCQHELDKSCILDLITSPSKGTPINAQGACSGGAGAGAGAGSGSTHARHASIKNSGKKQSDNIPVDLTAPCDVR